MEKFIRDGIQFGLNDVKNFDFYGSQILMRFQIKIKFLNWANYQCIFHITK